MPQLPARRLAHPSRTPFSRALVLTALVGVGVVIACGSGADDSPSPNTPVGGGGATSGGSVSSGGAAGASGGTVGSSGAPDAAAAGTMHGGEGGSDAPAADAGSPGAAGAPVSGPGPKQYPDVDFVYDGPTDAPVNPDETCALGSTDAVPVQLDMYIAFDRSGSMNLPQRMPSDGITPGGGDCNVGDSTASRWCYSINSLDAFFASRAARGTGVALQFFPAGGCTSSNNPFSFACCDSGACCRGGAEARPAVPLAELPAARGALVQALNAEIPWADRTPIEAALRGMIDYTTKARRPGRQMMGLLITDGGPEGCQSNASSLAKLVRTHRENTGIPIYIVGTQGAAFQWLETIAAAGGAPAHRSHCAGGVTPCHFYSVGSGKPDVFIEVLQQIRRSAIACQFAMPSESSGVVNPNEIALSFTPRGGGDKVRLNRVLTRAACGGSGGFYYDDNADPEHINLCPSSCEDLRAQDGGKVEVLLGCQGS